MPHSEHPSFDETVTNALALDGISLLEHSKSSRLLMIFLRHFGCTFCREAVADAAAVRSQLAAEGTKLAFVFMENAEQAATFFAQYGVADAILFSDPERVVYDAFQLGHASYLQMLKPSTLMRFVSAIGSGRGAAISETDMQQMPGSFLFFQGKILKAFRHKAVSDRPNYCELAKV